jgi:hypothetical protein
MAILLLGNQQLWGNYIETKWAGRALDLSPVVLLLVTAFSFWLWGITGMILAVPFFVIIKIVLENIEATRPIAILLSERAPSLGEAWEDALRDGHLSVGEAHKLKQLQELLGISDNAVTRVAGRSAAVTILKRGKVFEEEITLVNAAARGTAQEDDLKELLISGKLATETRTYLSDLVATLMRSEEEE